MDGGLDVGKNIVICLDGTNNEPRASTNTNVVRLHRLLDLGDPLRQVAYYDPGVGTFSAPGALTPPVRATTKLLGSAFGLGLRQNLGEAYTYLMQVHEPEDRIFLFGFSRGAYTARALAGLLEVLGLLRRGTENLVPYAIAAYARQQPRSTTVEAAPGAEDGGRRSERFLLLRQYRDLFSRDLGLRYLDHVPVHFVGLWDTVKAAGTLTRELRWPYTRALPNVATVRHAVALDERRRPYQEYLLHTPRQDHRGGQDQDRQEVWFAGVHSDVGGMFPTGARLSDIPLKWLAEEAVAAGLLVRPRRYAAVQRVGDDEATGAPHVMGRAWGLLGVRQRVVPEHAMVHASVRRRLEVDPGYGRRLPASVRFVDEHWEQPKQPPASDGSQGGHGEAPVPR